MDLPPLRRVSDSPAPSVRLGELGSNGENECPELPVGVDIKTACGIFADNWMQVADGLETPPQVAVSQEEKP